MAILNYTTSISPEKTIMEIQRILSKHKASSIMIDYDNGKPVSLTFMIMVENHPVNFRLPSNWMGVLKVLNSSNVASKYRNNDHALRVSWRIVKDWLAAQLALIESGQAEIVEILLPYAVTHSGETVYQRFKSNETKFLQQ